jgi:hypothetical protein
LSRCRQIAAVRSLPSDRCRPEHRATSTGQRAPGNEHRAAVDDAVPLRGL